MTSARHLSLATCHCPCHLPAGAPAPLFLSFGLREPRGSVRLGLGGRFPRASRFNFLRSALSLVFLVFIVKGPQESVENAPSPQRAQAREVKRTPGSEASSFLQGGKFFHELLDPIAWEADGQFCFVALTLAVDDNPEPVLRMPDLRPQLPSPAPRPGRREREARGRARGPHRIAALPKEPVDIPGRLHSVIPRGARLRNQRFRAQRLQELNGNFTQKPRRLRPPRGLLAEPATLPRPGEDQAVLRPRH